MEPDGFRAMDWCHACHLFEPTRRGKTPGLEGVRAFSNLRRGGVGTNLESLARLKDDDHQAAHADNTARTTRRECRSFRQIRDDGGISASPARLISAGD